MIQYAVWYLRKPLQRNWASSQAVVWPWPQRLKRRISSLQEHLNFGFWMVVLQLDGVMYKCVRGALEGLLTQAEIPEASWGQEILYRQVSSWYVQSSREQDPILLHVAFPIPFKPATGQEFELLSDADKIKAPVVSVKRCQGCYW